MHAFGHQAQGQRFRRLHRSRRLNIDNRGGANRASTFGAGNTSAPSFTFRRHEGRGSGRRSHFRAALFTVAPGTSASVSIRVLTRSGHRRRPVRETLPP